MLPLPFDPLFSLASSYNVHSRNVRSSQNHRPVIVESNIKRHSILCLGPRICARIPLNITDQPNLHAFRHLFKQLIIDSPMFLQPTEFISTHQHLPHPLSHASLSHASYLASVSGNPSLGRSFLVINSDIS